MAQVLIRDLDDEIKRKLKKRAKLHGISMEAEARLILANVLKLMKFNRVVLSLLNKIF